MTDVAVRRASPRRSLPLESELRSRPSTATSTEVSSRRSQRFVESFMPAACGSNSRYNLNRWPAGSSVTEAFASFSSASGGEWSSWPAVAVRRTCGYSGSVARNEETEVSDIDLLVDLEPGHTILDLVGLRRELTEALGVPVDVTTVGMLKKHLRSDILAGAIPL